RCQPSVRAQKKGPTSVGPPVPLPVRRSDRRAEPSLDPELVPELRPRLVRIDLVALLLLVRAPGRELLGRLIPSGHDRLHPLQPALLPRLRLGIPDVLLLQIAHRSLM